MSDPTPAPTVDQILQSAQQPSATPTPVPTAPVTPTPTAPVGLPEIAAPSSAAPAPTSQVDNIVAVSELNQSIGGAAQWNDFSSYMAQTADAATLKAYNEASATDRARIAKVFVPGFTAKMQEPAAATPGRIDPTEQAPSSQSPSTPVMDPRDINTRFADPRYVNDVDFRNETQRLWMSYENSLKG